MKHSFFLCLALITVGCNSPAKVSVRSGATSVDIESSARVGGRGGVLAKSSDVTVAVYDNNDESFREANRTVRFAIGASALKDIATTAANAATSINSTNQATKVVEANQATKVVEAKEATEQLKVTTEAAQAAQ